MDGDLDSTGPVVIDRIVRLGSVARAAEALVREARFGWQCAGGSPLTEPDEFLGGIELSGASRSEILDRHYAIYVLDPAHERLDVFADDNWLEPATFRPDGSLTVLPAWYPQLGSKTATRMRRPQQVTQELQEFCLKSDIAWRPHVEALSQWCRAMLGDLAGCQWLFKAGAPDSNYLRCLIDDVFVYTARDAAVAEFTGSDGRLRSIDIDNVELAEQLFRDFGLRPVAAIPTIKKWLSLAYESGSGQQRGSADWYVGTRRWGFNRPVAARTSPAKPAGGLTVVEDDPHPAGWVATLLSWLF